MDIKNIKKNLCIIEIENSSYCNRRCSYCSNFYIQREKDNVLLPEDLYRKVIDELSYMEYEREVTFHRYNEPFWNQNEFILDRISYAKKMLPKAMLETSTNGDYLDEEYLKRIEKTGLKKLFIQCHMEDFELVDRNEIHRRILEVNNRIGKFKGKFFDNYKKSVFVIINSKFETLSIQAENFKYEGFTRGEIVQNLIKKDIEGPCYQPLISMTIDYNGNVTLCSNTLSYYQKHVEYVLGNIREKSLEEIYNSSRAIAYRKKLLDGNREWICKHCYGCYKNRAKKNEII